MRNRSPARRDRTRVHAYAQSFDFSVEVRQLLRSLAERMGVSQVAVAELAIRHLAHRPGNGTAPGQDAQIAPPLRSGNPLSYRFTAEGRELLRELAGAPAPLGGTQVAVMERAIRQFGELAEREGLATLRTAPAGERTRRQVPNDTRG